MLVRQLQESPFFRLVVAEAYKLRRSVTLRMVWLLPLVFVFVDFFFFSSSVLGVRQVTSDSRLLLQAMPVKVIAILWAGFFHPLLIAILPALVVRPEHRFNTWKHLHTQPVSRRSLFAAKLLILLALFGLALGMVAVDLWAEWALIAQFKPVLAFPFPWRAILVVLGWSFLGSLPLLALYLWLSDRINSAAIPILFGLIGLVLTISLSGAELYPSWRRDLIPWVLPYICAQRAIEAPEARQEAHIAGSHLPKERDLSWIERQPKEWTLPSGRKARRSGSEVPRFLLDPPPPSPSWLLITFSIGAGLAFSVLGLVDAGRNRP